MKAFGRVRGSVTSSRVGNTERIAAVCWQTLVSPYGIHVHARSTTRPQKLILERVLRLGADRRRRMDLEDVVVLLGRY